jgi:hypothetical protein
VTIRTRIKDDILPILDEALSQGFRVFVLKAGGLRRAPVSFAYVCLDTDGSFAVVNSGHHRLNKAELAAPIKPNTTYGSSVLVDYSGTVHGAMQALRRTCEQASVTVRFQSGDSAPVVPNYGRKVLDKFPGGPGSFLELPPARQTVATPAAAVSEHSHTVVPDREKVLSHV